MKTVVLAKSEKENALTADTAKSDGYATGIGGKPGHVAPGDSMNVLGCRHG
jgi:hypothetical protein